MSMASLVGSMRRSIGFIRDVSRMTGDGPINAVREMNGVWFGTLNAVGDDIGGDGELVCIFRALDSAQHVLLSSSQ